MTGLRGRVGRSHQRAYAYRSMGQLVRSLQASKGKEAGLQNQLKDLDKGLKDVNRSTEDNSPAAIAQKQQQLQKLQKDVSRLQSSLGYDE